MLEVSRSVRPCVAVSSRRRGERAIRITLQAAGFRHGWCLEIDLAHFVCLLHRTNFPGTSRNLSSGRKARISLGLWAGKLNTVVEQIEHGHHILRAYYRNAFIKQYEKFSTYLRNEACSNNLVDFGLKKGLDHLAQVREKLLAVTDRFATFQAQWLNVHADFPLLQRLALPIAVGTAKYPGIKIHDARMIRLMEVLLLSGTVVSGWNARQIHEAILTSFRIGADRYGLNQLRYDLRKLKAHGLLARDAKRYAYRLTQKGTKVALLFILFHKQLCGPLANSLFHRQPAPSLRPSSELETAYHKADHSIQNIIQLLQAA